QRASSRGRPCRPRRVAWSASWPASTAWPCRLNGEKREVSKLVTLRGVLLENERAMSASTKCLRTFSVGAAHFDGLCRVSEGIIVLLRHGERAAGSKIFRRRRAAGRGKK